MCGQHLRCQQAKGLIGLNYSCVAVKEVSPLLPLQYTKAPCTVFEVSQPCM